MDIGKWLHDLGLQQYEQAFRDNAVDATVLRDLTADEARALYDPIVHLSIASDFTPM